MAENFFDAKSIKKSRGTNFMGGAKEVQKAPLAQSIKKASKVEPKAEVKTETEKVETAPKAEAKLVLKKGFIVGYAEDGSVLFRPFGEPSKLEIIGLVEYSKAIAKDILDELANTKINIIPAIKEGTAATLQALRLLLPKEDK